MTSDLDPFLRKLDHAVALSPAEKKELQSVFSGPVTEVPARQDIIRQGDSPSTVKLVLSGMACRYKVLPDGARQIMAHMLPGDFCDLHVGILGEMDHSIVAASACRLVQVPSETLDALAARSPRIARALWWCTLVDEAVLREWLVNLGQRDSVRALAHVLCELYWRMRTAGLADETTCSLPLTQRDLADTVGISTVYVNRILQVMRADGLIRLQDRRLDILKHDALMELAWFDPAYLHLDGTATGPANAANAPPGCDA